MNVLSLFDGISTGYQALKDIGVKVDKYYASEIDKYAIAVAKYNHKDIIHVGDVTKWQEWNIDWSSIGLITGGFPCQAWSVAGKQLGDKDERGMLFWVMLDIMKHIQSLNPDVKFLIENVKMKKDFEQYITQHTTNALGNLNKHLINSALVSAQNRQRYYWTNIEGITQPEDKGLLLRDIIEGSDYTNIASIVGRRLNESGARDDYNKDVPITQCLQVKHDNSKSNCLTTVEKDNVLTNLPSGRYANAYNQKALKIGNVNPSGNGMNGNVFHINGKSPTLTTNKGEGVKVTGCIQIGKTKDGGYEQNNRIYRLSGKSPCLSARDFKEPKKIGCIQVGNTKENVHNSITTRVYGIDGKSPTLTTCATGGQQEKKITEDLLTWRKLTPLECERLQTMSDCYTAIGIIDGKEVKISNSQRYKMLGNGWTLEVIKHILKHMEMQ